MNKKLANLEKLSKKNRLKIDSLMLHENFSVCNANLIKGKVTHFEPKIYDTISNNVNVQICLGNLLYGFENCDRDSVCVNLGFLNQNPTINQQKEIANIFEKIVILNLTNGYKVYQVSCPTKTAISVFKAMLEKDKLNKWVKYFYLRPLFIKPAVYAQYEYILNRPINSADNLDIVDDNFFEYVFYGSQIYVGSSNINVSGFSLEEIMQDVCIAKIAQKVSRLYLLVANGYKYLTWENVPSDDCNKN